MEKENNTQEQDGPALEDVLESMRSRVKWLREFEDEIRRESKRPGGIPFPMYEEIANRVRERDRGVETLVIIIEDLFRKLDAYEYREWARSKA